MASYSARRVLFLCAALAIAAAVSVKEQKQSPPPLNPSYTANIIMRNKTSEVKVKFEIDSATLTKAALRYSPNPASGKGSCVVSSFESTAYCYDKETCTYSCEKQECCPKPPPAPPAPPGPPNPPNSSCSCSVNTKAFNLLAYLPFVKADGNCPLMHPNKTGSGVQYVALMANDEGNHQPMFHHHTQKKMKYFRHSESEFVEEEETATSYTDPKILYCIDETTGSEPVPDHITVDLDADNYERYLFLDYKPGKPAGSPFLPPTHCKC